MTELMYIQATSGHYDLHQAVKQLQDEAFIRSLRETLAHTMGIPANQHAELRAKLVQALMASSPDARRDSVERKVRMWLKDDVRSISKQSAIQLCFALGLAVSDANVLLIRLCEEGFHWRDPQEIVFLFAMQHGMNYAQASELRERMAEKGLMAQRSAEDASVFTGQVRPQIEKLTTVEELEAFLRDAQGQLGTMHNTAYSLFMDFLNLLEKPQLDDKLTEVESISKREILDTYLYREFIPRIQRAVKGKDSQAEKVALSALQQSIRQNWPDETTLSRMVARDVDVNRKVLILLFLATDGGATDYGDDILDEQTPEDVFQDKYERMNSMLYDCGFAPLDARAPFDWMILYCMCADESLFIDGRIQRFLAELYPELSAVPELADGNTTGNDF